MSSFRYSFVSFLGRHPSLFSAYYRSHPRYARLTVRPDSELVIEGYPRCANSFAVLAFERAQGRRLKMGHHLHAPAQIALGVRYRLPVLALIREPLGAVASLVTRHPDVSVEQAVEQYARFYESVLAYRDQLVLADFRAVTTDYGRVIGALNRKFGTRFVPYINSASEDEAVFAEIDQLNEDGEGGQVNQLARPSEGKSELLAEARRRVEAHPLFARAREVYGSLAPACV